MSQALIREIAQQIVNEQVSSMWPIYLLMLALALVGAFFGSFLASYAKKTAEIRANEANFGKLQHQLRENTKTTEEIKAAVNYDDWVMREWKALRQKKLEELLQCVYEADHWQCINREATLFNSGKGPGSTPLSSVQLLSALYFPELREPIANFVVANRNLERCISIHKPHFDVIPIHLREEVLRNSFSEKWDPLYDQQAQMIKQLEARSGELVATWYVPNKKIQPSPEGATA
jgi:hypothetical protein